jgi:hypothetical protein
MAEELCRTIVGDILIAVFPADSAGSELHGLGKASSCFSRSNEKSDLPFTGTFKNNRT